MVPLDRIVEAIKERASSQKDLREKVKQRSIRERQIALSTNSHASLIDKLKSRPSYRINPRAIPNPVTDPYARDFVITQIKGRYRSQISDPTLDVSQIRADYQVIVNDNSIINPFVISRELVRIIKKHTKNKPNEEAKARAIFDWIEKNIQYGESKKTYGYSNTSEVLRDREAVCGEMAFLYVTMARSVNLRSNYVSVTKDCFGKKIHHACAVVDIGHRDILVDPAYHQFDVKHIEFKVLTDAQVIERFNQWR